MAVIAGCYGVHQVTATPDLGLCIQRQASCRRIELGHESLGFWPRRKKLWYEQTALGIDGIIRGIDVAKRGKGHRRKRKGGFEGLSDGIAHRGDAPQKGVYRPEIIERHKAEAMTGHENELMR